LTAIPTLTVGKKGIRERHGYLVTTYRIAIKGILDAYWREWLSPYVIRVDVIEDGNSLTVLTVQVPDQAALRGILCRIWDFNLFLVSVVMESGNNLQN
jgi:hypothetical protein